MPVYLLTYELRPSPANAELDGIGGAFASCWIKRPSLDEATRFAGEHLTASGWVILSAEESRVVTADNLREDLSRYFRQAEVDGEVFVLHSFPPEEPDA